MSENATGDIIYIRKSAEYQVFGLGLAWHIAVSLVADNYELTQTMFVQGRP